MQLSDYQKQALNTWNPPERIKELDISYLALGLGNEAGEVQGKIKKLLRGDYKLTPEIQEALEHELGDVLWYLSTLAHEFGISLDSIAQSNLNKLADRKQRNVIQGNGDNR